jgi:GTP cyclohydrolase FolE2
VSRSADEALARAVAVGDELVEDSNPLLTVPRWLDETAVVFVPIGNRRYVEATVRCVAGNAVRVTVLGHDEWLRVDDIRVHKDSPYT